ncbi:hypothetical protein [Silicimonas sp. MF1-12-2]|uniref:hypothetical protein n=1 Tax=Silicimonas sp. MF1-12-2 TaxID=3384793 RepID=UPI0039B4D472
MRSNAQPVDLIEGEFEDEPKPGAVAVMTGTFTTDLATNTTIEKNTSLSDAIQTDRRTEADDFPLRVARSRALIEVSMTAVVLLKSATATGVSTPVAADPAPAANEVAAIESAPIPEAMATAMAASPVETRLDGAITLKSILERELEAGFRTFGFALERKGEMWVEEFNLASLSN